VPPEHKASFRTCQPITGPGGSAIVVVLLLTAALTVLGVMSINSGLIELQLVLNGKESTKRFYLLKVLHLKGFSGLPIPAQLTWRTRLCTGTTPWSM
jgi:hypothetical protein